MYQVEIERSFSLRLSSFTQHISINFPEPKGWIKRSLVENFPFSLFPLIAFNIFPLLIIFLADVTTV